MSFGFANNSKNNFNSSSTNMFDVYSHNFKNNDFDLLLDLRKFKNYYSSLSSLDLNTLSLVAIKIVNVNSLYSKASQNDFYFALTEVVHSIISIFNTDCRSISYAGNGIFLMLSNRSLLKSSITQETEVQKHLNCKNLKYENSRSLDIYVSVSNPIWPKINALEIENIIFSCAIVRAENRALRKSSQLSSQNSHSSLSSLI